MSNMGAILVLVISDAGGRNVAIRVISRSKNDRMIFVIGMEELTHVWYLYLLIYFLSPYFASAAFTGLKYDLKNPNFEFIYDEKPLFF